MPVNQSEPDSTNVASADPMKIASILNEEPIPDNPKPRGKRRLQSRPKYNEEQALFIWYHRIDLNMEWDAVWERFEEAFPGRGKAGLQCKFYRILSQYQVAKVREQSKLGRTEGSSKARQFGMANTTGRRFWWMKQRHQSVRQLHKL
jgi:hypothetical protein